MLSTRLTQALGIEQPILQGGLQLLALAPLCAAVSEAGGLGQVSATSIDGPAELDAEIREVRRRTSRPFAINYALGYRMSEALFQVALDHHVPAISFTAGNPEPYLARLRGSDTKTIVLVAGVRQAQKAEALGADIVIAVGYEGGGHLGRDDIGSLVLIPRVVDAVRIPVVASGGFADGRGLAAALCLGAAGVELGTRFVATTESPAHPRYKQAIIDAAESDTTIIERSAGRPGRVLRTSYAERIRDAEAAGIDRDGLYRLISRPNNARAALGGDLEHGYVWCGESAALIDRILPAGEVIRRTVAEAETILERQARAISRHRESRDSG